MSQNTGILTARQAGYLDYGRQIRNGMAHGHHARGDAVDHGGARRPLTAAMPGKPF
ncbi:hypothetical protein [Streptomyces sp. NPDC003015]